MATVLRLWELEEGQIARLCDADGLNTDLVLPFWRSQVQVKPGMRR